MNVNGVVISAEVLARAETWFPPARTFTYRELAGALVRLGVPYEVSDRTADRLLQKWRRAETHTFSAGKWKRVGSPAPASALHIVNRG